MFKQWFVGRWRSATFRVNSYRIVLAHNQRDALRQLGYGETSGSSADLSGPYTDQRLAFGARNKKRLAFANR